MKRSIFLALAAVLAFSGSALAVETNQVKLTQVTITPFVEITGVAGTIDWDAAGAVFGGNAPVANITMTAGGKMTLGTNAVGGYRFSAAFSSLTGATHAGVIPFGNVALRLASVAGTTQNLLTYKPNGVTVLGNWDPYTGASAGTMVAMWDCATACKDATAGQSEQYELDLRLTIPAAVIPDDYNGAMSVRVETL